YAVPKVMSRIAGERRLLPVAVLIPAAIVATMIITAMAFSGGDPGFGFPRGPVLFDHYVNDGWIDVFTLSLVRVVAVLSCATLRRFWAALQATAPTGGPPQPISRAVGGAV